MLGRFLKKKRFRGEGWLSKEEVHTKFAIEEENGNEMSAFVQYFRKFQSSSIATC